MKRELKHPHDDARLEAVEHCRAYPDEKGIETDCFGRGYNIGPDCRAYPDEKGIETPPSLKGDLFVTFIAEPIPMKRELKHF